MLKQPAVKVSFNRHITSLGLQHRKMSEVVPLQSLEPNQTPPVSNPNPNPNTNNNNSTYNNTDHPYRFQRTDLWLPAYEWLESLDDRDQLISTKEATDWLSQNRDFQERILAKHSKYHLMHYIQKLHLKLLKKKGKIPKTALLSNARAPPYGSGAKKHESLQHSTQKLNSGERRQKTSSGIVKNIPRFGCKESEAALRYQVLTDLQNHLTTFLSKCKNESNLEASTSMPMLKQCSHESSLCQSSIIVKNEEFTRHMPGAAVESLNAVTVQVEEQVMSTHAKDLGSGERRKKHPIITASAWSYSEASSGTAQAEQISSSHFAIGETSDSLTRDANASSLEKSFPPKNVHSCLKGREVGILWPFGSPKAFYAGKKQEKWLPYLRGWRSLNSHFEGPAVVLKQRSYSYWLPTWSAYTSNASVQSNEAKVLDIKFHPEGLPQLVCSSDQIPNELLLYNLRSGRAIQLSGHNCQIQAVDFAVMGASIVSCASKSLKIWDCITGSCLFTLGSSSEDQANVGHTQKINAMCVNSWQSSLVATSGATGDGKLLLWNALRGELSTDLNSFMRERDELHPSMNVMEFCSENLLACGSDCEHGGSAIVQLWDLDSPQSCLSFPANDSYITSLKANIASDFIITGSGDGTVGLFDIRTRGVFNYLSIGSSCEVTSVSLSSCGTYFSVSSTLNNTMVWDTRLMPTNSSQMPLDKCSQVTDAHFFKPLHCLSHGKQMPTTEFAGQLPGHIKEGDQGINDSRWLQGEPVLITASGDGSIAMWDVTLGMPCVRHIASHSRSVNTLAVAPNDEYICSGGDDQKIVLYNNKAGTSHQKWRLSHPLSEQE